MIIVRSLEKKYKRKKALKNIKLELTNTGFVSIVGESGSGKTTLLKCIGLSLKFDGNILIDNCSLIKLSKTSQNFYKNKFISFLTQDFSLIEELNIKENIELPFLLRKEKIDLNVIEKGLIDVGLNRDFLTKKVNELSQGERQRIALLRAILNQPKILLCDEPTGNLDSKNSKIIYDILKKLSQKILVLVVSHSESLTREYSDRIITLEKGEILSDEVLNETKENEENIFEIENIKLKQDFLLRNKLGLKILLSKPLFTIILCLLSSICFGIISSSSDLNHFNRYQSTQECMNVNHDKVIEVTGTYIEEEGSTLFNSELDESEINNVASYFLNEKVTYLPIFNSSYIDEFIENASTGGNFSFDSNFSFINLDVYTGFNFDIFGSFPDENEFLISQDFLVDLNVINKEEKIDEEEAKILIDQLNVNLKYSENNQYGLQVSGIIKNIVSESTTIIQNLYQLDNFVLFNENICSTIMNQIDSRASGLIFSSNNDGYLKAINYINNDKKLLLENYVILEGNQKEMQTTALSIFLNFIIVLLLILEFVILFNYVYTLKAYHNKTFEILNNNGANSIFYFWIFLSVIVLILVITIGLGVGAGSIINVILNAISTNAYIKTIFPIASLHFLSILFSSGVSAAIFLIGFAFLFFSKKVKKI